MELKIYFSRISSQSCRKKRAKFVEIKKSLKHLRNIYAMLYPPRLQVAALGETHFFNTPNEALAWLEKQRDSIALDPSWIFWTCRFRYTLLMLILVDLFSMNPAWSGWIRFCPKTEDSSLSLQFQSSLHSNNKSPKQSLNSRIRAENCNSSRLT